MHAWEQISSTLDYIEEHLAEELGITTLSTIACLSPFYFQRLFRRLVKTSVNDYIKRRRLARASELLLQQDGRILDTALECGFSSHEVFTRTFKEHYQITPEAYRENPIRLNQFNKPDLLLGYLLVDENTPLITEGIVLEISRKTLEQPEYFLGMSIEAPFADMPTGRESNADKGLGQLWDQFHARKKTCTALIPNGEEIGVMTMGSQEGYFRYFAGAQAETEHLDSWDSWILPTGNYILCTFEAEDFEHLVMDALYTAHRYLFDMWLPKHNIVTEFFAAERYHSHTGETTAMAIWVKIK